MLKINDFVVHACPSSVATLHAARDLTIACSDKCILYVPRGVLMHTVHTRGAELHEDPKYFELQYTGRHMQVRSPRCSRVASLCTRVCSENSSMKSL